LPNQTTQLNQVFAIEPYTFDRILAEGRKMYPRAITILMDMGLELVSTQVDKAEPLRLELWLGPVIQLKMIACVARIIEIVKVVGQRWKSTLRSKVI
jgi:hypothetical protein